MSIALYELIDLRNQTAIYVGITKNPNRREKEHHAEMRNGSQQYLYKKMRKIYREGGRVKLVVLRDSLTLSEAYQEEVDTIKKYRESGVKLCNLTDGGEGGKGHKPVFTEEWKAKLSISAKKRVARDGVPFKGKRHTQETRKKLSENHYDNSGEKNPFYGRQHSDSFKRRLADERTGVGLKEYIITSPDGTEYHVTEGLNAFCKRMSEQIGYQLSPSGFSSVAKGRYKTSKGWVVKYRLPLDSE